MLDEVKRQLIAEKGVYRAILIPIVFVSAFVVIKLVIYVAEALALSVGIFLLAVFILNLILPDSLKTVAFSAGARGLDSGIGIMLTLCFIAARYLASFLWWSRWVWMMLIAPLAIFFGIRNLYDDTISSFSGFRLSNLFPTTAGVQSFLVSLGDPTPGVNLITIALAVAFTLAWGSVLDGW